MTSKHQWDVIGKLIGKRGARVLLYGPPGTGKTTTALKTLRAGIGRKRTRRVYNCYITPETSAAELMGFFAPAEDGTFKWQDGPITAAMRSGSPLVINEIDDVQGDAETALMGVLDDPEIAQYELMSGEYVSPADGFAVVCTMNGDPAELRPALLDRMDFRFRVEEPHPDAIAALPADLRRPAQRAATGADGRRLSIRPWRAYEKARQLLGNDQDAAHAVWSERAGDVLDTLRLHASKE